MKIDYLKLINFSNIYTALKTTEMCIDFRKSKNKIILFNGPNGSGKTSILSCLHPFATNGNLDIRNDNSLVLDGKDGYKEIQISDDSDIYIIKHFYVPSKNTHSTKSYITKNGIELNENGNVSSFKSIIKEELDIEMDYLKLIRLGSNVTNFIELKTTERKSFMGKILEEVDVYLKYHKKVSEDMRKLKSIISHLLDKINKLSIDNENDMEKTQKSLKKNIDKYESTINSLNEELSVINYQLNQYDTPLVVKETLDNKRKELEKIDRVLTKKESKDIDIDGCKNLINKINDGIILLKLNLTSLTEKRFSLLTDINKLISEKDEISKQISYIRDNQDIKDTEYMISQLRQKIQKRSDEINITNYNPPCSKKEMESLVIMLDKCNEILYSTYEFGREPIKKALEYIVQNTDITEYITSNKNKINKNRLQETCEYVYNKIGKKYGKVKCNSNCNALSFYNEVYEMATEVPDDIIEDDEFITYTKMAYQNIQSIINNIKDFSSVFNKMSNDIKVMFLFMNIVNRIENLKPLYDKEVLYNELSLITEYELQEEDIKTLSDLKEKLTLQKKSIGNYEYFNDKLKSILDDIESNKENLEDINYNISKINSELSNNENDSMMYTEIYDSIQKKDSIKSEYNDLHVSYEKIKELISKKKEKMSFLQELMFSYDKIKNEYNNNEYRLKSFKELNNELDNYQLTYDEMDLVKKSLSSKEGIPLLFIQVYLKNIQEITNELLEIIYDNELFIESFNITSDEFKIPYNTKGTSIKDIAYASQGEKSFISLALSFALIYQSISRYNIMLLDEIDATLDTKNREKFLQILERQMSMIDSEQIFVISHNNMFNMYPVDIVDMKNKIDTNNKLANYIKIKIK